MQSDADLDFMTLGTSPYGFCKENSTKSCEALLQRGLSKHHILLGALASAWEYEKSAEYRGWIIGSVGHSSQMWTSIFIRSLEQFAISYGDPQDVKLLTYALKKGDLKDHPDDKQAPSAMLKRYQQDLPVLIATGYVNHAVCAILYKDYLIIGNRGENNDGIYPTVIYTINSKKVNADTFDTIQKLREKSAKSYVSYIKTLSHTLDAVRILMSDTVREIYKGDVWQKVGNCSWSSLEAGLIGLWTVISWEQSKNPKDIVEHLRYGENSLNSTYLMTIFRPT